MMRRRRLLAVDKEVKQDGRRRVLAQQLELVRVDADVRRWDAMAEDNARKAPGAPQAGNPLARLLTALGGERGTSCGGVHWTRPRQCEEFG